MFVNEREFIAEVVEIGDELPVQEGQTGELVLTQSGALGLSGDPVSHRRPRASGALGFGPPAGRRILGRVDQMMPDPRQ